MLSTQAPTTICRLEWPQRSSIRTFSSPSRSLLAPDEALAWHGGQGGEDGFIFCRSFAHIGGEQSFPNGCAGMKASTADAKMISGYALVLAINSLAPRIKSV